MKIAKDDPRLTAYLLNDISTEDRLLVEQALRESSEIKEELEKLKKGMDLLKKNSPVEDDFFKLTNQQRQQIFDQISNTQPNFLQRFMRGPWGYVTAGLVTASFAFMIFNHSLQDQVSQSGAMTKEEIVANEMQKINDVPAAAPQALSVPAKPSSLRSKESVDDKAASAPKPQMAEAERKKSVSLGSTFGAGSQTSEGNSKGGSAGFKKMQPQSLADSASSVQADFTGPSVEFLLQTDPALPQNLREKLHAAFHDCLLSPDGQLTSFKLKWDGIKANEVEPVSALTSSQKSCLEDQLKNTLGPKKDILVIKVNSVSK